MVDIAEAGSPKQFKIMKPKVLKSILTRAMSPGIKSILYLFFPNPLVFAQLMAPSSAKSEQKRIFIHKQQSLQTSALNISSSVTKHSRIILSSRWCSQRIVDI